MGVNKVTYGGKTVVDLTDATASPDTVLAGYTAYGADGNRIVGTAKNCGRIDLDIALSPSAWGYDGRQTVSAPGVTRDNVVIATVDRWGVHCVGEQTTDSLVFCYTIKPTVTVTAHVIILDL